MVQQTTVFQVGLVLALQRFKADRYRWQNEGSNVLAVLVTRMLLREHRLLVVPWWSNKFCTVLVGCVYIPKFRINRVKVLELLYTSSVSWTVDLHFV